MCVAILISNKIDVKLKSSKRDIKEHSILVTGKIHQEEISIPNSRCSATTVASYVKERLLKLKLYIKRHTLIVGDFNTPLSPLDRSVRQNINREIKELTDVMTEMDLTDTYRVFHPNRKEYTFFSAPHGNFSKPDYILCNKKILKIQKKIE